MLFATFPVKQDAAPPGLPRLDIAFRNGGWRWRSLFHVKHRQRTCRLLWLSPPLAQTPRLILRSTPTARPRPRGSGRGPSGNGPDTAPTAADMPLRYRAGGQTTSFRSVALSHSGFRGHRALLRTQHSMGQVVRERLPSIGLPGIVAPRSSRIADPSRLLPPRNQLDKNAKMSCPARAQCFT